jgi:hypothetical protein
MVALFRRFALILLVAGLSSAAQADQQDISAAARGVVRVALVATNGDESYFVGHGTGFAVAPDKVLTNAHVVELTRDEKNIVIGVVPSEGGKSHGGKVIAYSPGNDLALVQLDDGTLPVSTFYAGAVQDGQHVTAVGYPGAVDRAQGLGLQQLIQPAMPVKTGGNISSGRSSQSFDTILHTAPLAAGNSGGPLVDDCGRVLGVNSFGSVSDGSDAEFGFAVSNREVASFLRQAGVQFRRTMVPCKSIAQLDEADARQSAIETARKDADARAKAEARETAMEQARDAAERDVIAGRENVMALAAVLLALSVLGIGAAGLFYTQGKRKPMKWFGAFGVLFLFGALLAFVLKPSFSSIEDRIDVPQDNAAAPVLAVAEGDNVCRIDEARSRITVSELQDIALNWNAGGCVNGRTQFLRTSGPNGDQWERTLVPEREAVIAVNRFDPATGIFRSDRYLADSDTMENARKIRSGFDLDSCSANPETLARLQKIQADIRAVLPAQPNERLVYACRKGQLDAAPEGGDAD